MRRLSTLTILVLLLALVACAPSRAQDRQPGPGPLGPPAETPKTTGSGGTYYMRADGTAATRARATGPSSDPANCMNVSVHNGETFTPGDTILLCGDGGPFTSQIRVPSSGSRMAAW
jgi:hypothetical protein